MEGAKSVKIEALSSAEFDRLDFGHVLDTKRRNVKPIWNMYLR